MSISRVIFPEMIPAPGKWEDPCGLFGVERDESGMLRATASGRVSKWAVDVDAAHELMCFHMPDGHEIALGIKSHDAGLEAEARNEVYHFPAAWDMNAPTAMLNSMSNELRSESVRLFIGTLRVSPAPDGLFYLECSTGPRSKVGATTRVAAGVMEAWEGLPPTAALECEDPMTGVPHIGEMSEIAQRLIARWEAECPRFAASLEQMDALDREADHYERMAIIECVSALDGPSALEAMVAVEHLFD